MPRHPSGLFPGAQWLGDGTSVAIYWRDRHFIFNIEAMLDVASNGLVGATASDVEDEDAILAAYGLGKETAEAPPLALTLDNKPCNHAPGVAEGIGDAEQEGA